MPEQQLTIVPARHCFEIPESLAKCPYCEAKLYAHCNAWSQEEDGTWIAEEMEVDCDSEPDIDSGKWKAWFREHSDMPYVHWLPVRNTIEAWINQNYRFNVED